LIDIRWPPTLPDGNEIVEFIVYALFAIVGKLFWSVIPITTRDPIQQNGGDDGFIIFDSTLMYEYIANADVTVGDITLGILGIAGPLAFFVVATSCVLRHEPMSTSDSVASYLTSLGINEFMTEFGKRYVGRLRPNFFSMCEFDQDTMSCISSLARIEQSRKR